MADANVKDLLARFKIDGSGWKAAVADMRALLKQAAAEDQVRAAANKAAQDASIAAAKQEVAIRQSISKANKDAVSGEVSKASAIKATASASSRAASEQLSATKAQIAAEKEKGLAIKNALDRQKQAAANAIAFEKAYQAQVADAAKTKAKAAALFDAAYRSQVAEVQKNKKLQVQPRAPQAAYSSVPLISTAEKQVAKVKATPVKTATQAVQAPVAVDIPAKTTEAVASSTLSEAKINELKTEQIALNTKIEEQEIAIGQRRSAVTGKFITKDSKEAVLAPGAIPTNVAAKQATAAVDAERAAQEKLGSEITAIINRTNAANRASATEKQHAISAERAAQEHLGSEIIAIMHRTDAEAAQAAAKRRQEEAALAAEKRKEAQAELLEQRKIAHEKAEQAREAAEKPSLGRLFKEPATILAGGKSSIAGGLVGSLLGGAELGAGLLAFEAIEKALTGIVEKAKEFIEDSGGLQKVTETFQNLSAGKGYDSGAFLEQLQDKTQHLVSEVDLLRVANTFMQSGLKVSKEDMLELTEATVGLARGQGKDATQAVQALTRTFLTGGRGAMQLARIVGIQGPQLMLRGFGSTEGMAARQQATFANMAKVIKQRYEEMGQPAITYTDRLKQVQVVSTELYEHIAQGAVKSAGFATLMNSFGTTIEQMGGLEVAAERAGSAIGNFFAPLAVVFESIIPTLSAVGDAFSAVATTAETVVGVFSKDVSPVDKLSSSFANLHPVLDLTIKLLAGVAAAAQFTANAVSLTANVTSKFASMKTPSMSSDEYTNWLEDNNHATGENGKPTAIDRASNYYGSQGFKKDWQSQDHEKGKSFTDLWNDFRGQVAEGETTRKNTVTNTEKTITKFNRQSATQSNNLRSATGLPIVLPSDKAKVDTWETKTLADVEAKNKELATQVAAITAQQHSGKLNDLEATTQITDLTKTTNDSIVKTKKENASSLGLQYKEGVSPTTAFNDQGLNRRHANQLALANMQDIKAKAQDDLEDQKANIAQESEYNERMYKTGKETYTAYYEGKKQFADETLSVVLANNKKEEQADRDVLTEKLKHKDLFPDVSEKDFDKITEEYKRKNTSAQQTHTATYASASLGNQEESIKLAKENIQNTLKVRLDALALEKDAVSNSYKEQRVTTEEYFSYEKANIEQTRDLHIAALNAEIAANGPLKDDNIALFAQITQLADDAKKQIQDLNNTKIQTTVQNIGERHSTATGLLNATQTAQNSPLQNTSYSSQVQTQNAIYAESVNYLDKLNAQLIEAAQTVGVSSKTWTDIATQIQTASNELDQVILKQEQLRNAGTLSGQAATLGVAGGSAFGNIFGGRYAKGLEGAFSAGGASAQGAQANVDQMRSGFGAMSFAPIASMFHMGGSSSSNGPGASTIGDDLSAFSKGLQGAIQAVGSFASSIANAGSASAGAAGGAISGAGMGEAAGSAAQSAAKPGSALSNLGGAAGPLGALVGGALGAAMGAVMGQKQEMVQNDINQLSADFKGIMNQYSSNNQSLNATIASLTVLVAEAQMMQATTKKGGSQFTSLIQQYNTQIVQLEDQQTQIMAQLNQQLIQASAPTGYQSIIQSIQQVLQQYTSFVGAAANATDLANANNYLTSSLQNLAVSYSDQVNQGQQQAIQDALSLNQLYNQRNQLEYQYLQQVQSIQGQGTLTRGVTQSQSKYSQLYNLDVQQSNQLLDINSQINLEQYKVTAAQQIFTLATTQVGLQTQLLNLQQVGINEDMQRLAAMQNVLGVLQQTGYSLTNLGSLNTSDPNALLTMLLQLLANQLGVNVGGSNNPTGFPYGIATGHLDNLAAGAYSTRAQYGYGSFRSTNI